MASNNRTPKTVLDAPKYEPVMKYEHSAGKNREQRRRMQIGEPHARSKVIKIRPMMAATMKPFVKETNGNPN